MSDNTPVPDDEAVCFLRAELNSLRAHNVSLKAEVEWFEREQQIWHSNIAALRAEIEDIHARSSAVINNGFPDEAPAALAGICKAASEALKK